MNKALLALCLTLAFSGSALSATNDEIMRMVYDGQTITNEQQQQLDAQLRNVLAKLNAQSDKAKADYADALDRLDSVAMKEAADEIYTFAGMSASFTQMRYKAFNATEEAKQAADAKKEKAQQPAQVDDLFGDLAEGKNSPKGGGTTKTNSTTSSQQGTSGADVNSYAKQINAAIQSKFYSAAEFTGKTCDLKIKLQPNGILADIQSVGGDAGLCAVAIEAAKKAHIPKPPSQAAYEAFKSAIITVKPQ